MLVPPQASPLLYDLGALSQVCSLLPRTPKASAASLQVPRRCTHLQLYFCRAGDALLLLLLLLLPCSEHRWPPSHPRQTAGLTHLLCTLLPHELD